MRTGKKQKGQRKIKTIYELAVVVGDFREVVAQFSTLADLEQSLALRPDGEYIARRGDEAWQWRWCVSGGAKRKKQMARVRQIQDNSSTITVQAGSAVLLLQVVAESGIHSLVHWMEGEGGAHKAGIYVACEFGEELYESRAADIFEGRNLRWECRKTDDTGSLAWVILE